MNCSFSIFKVRILIDLLTLRHILILMHLIAFAKVCVFLILFQTFTGHATEVFQLVHIPVEESIEQSYFLSAARGDRLINAW